MTSNSAYIAYGEGPDPIMDYMASKEAAASIENKFVAGEAVTEREAHIYLNRVVVDARRTMEQRGRQKSDAAQSLARTDLLMACGLGQSLTAHPLVAAALPTKLLQLAHLPHSKNRHSAVATRIPIRGIDGVKDKTFLIDITWRQYFTAGMRSSKVNWDNPGNRLVSSKTGAVISNELLREGFIDVSDGASGQAYFSAHNSGQHINVKDYLNRCPSDSIDHDLGRLTRMHVEALTTVGGRPYRSDIRELSAGWLNAKVARSDSERANISQDHINVNRPAPKKWWSFQNKLSS